MTTLTDDVQERVGSYIRHQAAKEPDAIRDIVQTGHDKLLALLDGMSEKQAGFKPSPDDWSVLEVLDHVVTAKRGVARTCVTLARGDVPAGIGEEGQENSQQDGITGKHFASLAEARAGAEAAHAEMIEFIGGIAQGVDVDARFDHFLFGPLNCREWAAFQRVHDGDHGNQIEKVLASAGYPAP
ncbi:MAG: DinB family protein [Chloroflexi bacterium]|nr:DinB family protein [Chloroflexota bacterium]